MSSATVFVNKIRYYWETNPILEIIELCGFPFFHQKGTLGDVYLFYYSKNCFKEYLEIGMFNQMAIYFPSSVRIDFLSEFSI